MPKMKTNKSIVRRIKLTGRGKLLRRMPGAGHLKSRKSPSRLRRFRKQRSLSPAFSRIARMMLGS